MGLCVSTGSSDQIHEATEYGHENAVLYNEDSSPKDKGLASVCSKPGSKGVNQDSAILHQGYGGEMGGAGGGVFCGVFDGHGQNGRIVSKLVRDRLPAILMSQKNALSKTGPLSYSAGSDKSDGEYPKWEQTCVTAFKAMDKEIKLQSLDCSCSGTTAVVAIRQGQDLVIANLGDSRALLGTGGENGELKALQLTTDLKPGVPSEAERIRKCKGRVLALKEEPHIQRVWLPHEDAPGLAMSRAFGDFMLKNYGVTSFPDVSCHRLNPNDHFLLLASDGVWDVLSNEEAVSVAWGVGSEDEAAEAVVEAAAAAWKKRFPTAKVDDITVACLFFNKRQRTIKP